MTDFRSLFITHEFPPANGGIARMYGELCRRLPDLSVSSVRGSALPDSPHVAVHTMPFDEPDARNAANLVRWGAWTSRFVRRGDVRFIHVGNIKGVGYIGSWMRARHGVPYCVYVHGKDLMKERRKAAQGPLKRAGIRSIFGNASAIIANSRATADYAAALLRDLGCAAAVERIHVVHPGTDAQRCRPAPGAVAEWRRTRLPGDGPVLLTVARLIPRKGIDTMIEALPAVRAAVPAVRYLIAGDGPDVPRLKQLASERGVADALIFAGRVSDAELAACYGSADLFVMPARMITETEEVEGFGLVYVEAAANGVPSIAANSGGAPEAVAHERTGIIVEPGDAHALAQATIALLVNPERRQALGEAARERVESYFNWDRAAAEIQAIAAAAVSG